MLKIALTAILLPNRSACKCAVVAKIRMILDYSIQNSRITFFQGVLLVCLSTNTSIVLLCKTVTESWGEIFRNILTDVSKKRGKNKLQKIKFF